MKKLIYAVMLLFVLAVLGSIVACAETDNPDDGGKPQDKDISVTGITLDITDVSIKAGETAVLTPTIIPDNATNKSVTWSSSSEDVATVDNNGKVTGIKEGSATITVTTVDGGKKASCSLIVEPTLAPSVTVGAEHVSAVSAVLKGKANLGSTVSSDLKVGFQYSKSAGILPSNSTMVEADDADVNYNYTTGIINLEPETTYFFRSFVRQNGQDTYGETMEFKTSELSKLLETLDATDINATSAILRGKVELNDVRYASKNVFYGFNCGMSDSYHDVWLEGGEIKDNVYLASLTDLSHKTQYWYRSYLGLDDQIIFGEVKYFTTDVVPVESVSLDKTEFCFNTIGKMLSLNATVLPFDATDKSIEWFSDNESVATVSSLGIVKAIGNGLATITVKVKDQDLTATCIITVAQWLTSINLNRTSLTMNEKETATLAVSSFKPDNAYNTSVTWSSSDESVATVDDTGKVTAVSKGTATIKAMANDGSGTYSTCSVTVRRLVSSILLDKTSMTIYTSQTGDITATVSPSTANNTAIIWTSSNTDVATVSTSGVVTGRSCGTAIITASSNDGSEVQASCEVDVRQAVTNITFEVGTLSVVVGEETSVTAIIYPTNAYDKSLSWVSSDESVATVDDKGMITAISKGQTTITATTNDGSNLSANCGFIVSSACPAGAVDLGFTTEEGYKLYWATCNICEEGFVRSPEMLGDQYAWGEIEPKLDYSWSTYIWCDGSSSTLTKYNFNSSYGIVDEKIVLDPEDDLAHVKLGGSWRIPTDAEWASLIYSSPIAYTLNGAKGILVSANNGNSIFLPYASYWSSSLFIRYPDHAVRVLSNPYGTQKGNEYRYKGLSIRPVTE